MVASATDALSESVHGMALALYGFLFGRRGLFWMNFGSSGGPLASILKAHGSQKWSLGRVGVILSTLRPPKVDFGALEGSSWTVGGFKGGSKAKIYNCCPSMLRKCLGSVGVKNHTTMRAEICLIV